ncbi:hypothetical protein KR044_005970, partial [Drosophila immigrans]
CHIVKRPLQISLRLLQVLASFEVTSINIVSKDDKYAIIEKCQIQAVNRSLKFFNLHVKLLQLPVRTVLVKWALLKQSNGYLPFNQNYTLDACKFMRHSNHLINNFLYSMFKDYTNLNHTCPYDHDIIIDKFPTRSSKGFDLLFMPKGDYAIEASWYTDDVLRSEAKVYFKFF